MRTTIDRAGRVVIPKAMRAALGLVDGGEVDLAVEGGKISIAPPQSAHHVEYREGRPVIVYDEPVPTLDDDTMYSVIDELRER